MVRNLSPADAPLTVQSFFANGQPGPLTATMAHVPELLNATMPFISKALSPAALSFRQELIILRTSVLQQCSYCVGTHSVVALKADLSDDEINALRCPRLPTRRFLKVRNGAAQWVERLTQTAAVLTDENRKRASEHYEEHEIVDLLICVGATMMLNRYATALELPLAAAHIDVLASKGWL